MMKKLCILLVALLLAATPALAEEVEVAGYVLEADAFAAMEEGFRTAAFDGEMYTVELTETQTLMFVPEETEHIVPSFTVMIREPVALVDDLDEMVAIVQSMLEMMQMQQGLHPEAMAFNNEMVQPYLETGLGFAVADRSIWLWAEDGSGMMLPIYLHDATTNALADSLYLLSICRASADSGYYALYNEAAQVVEYLSHVEIRSDASTFQQALALWYMESFVSEADLAAAQAEASAPETEANVGDRVRVTTNGGNARAEGSEDAEVVQRIAQGKEYTVVSVTDQGWYEIELEDGQTAFISSKIVEVVAP